MRLLQLLQLNGNVLIIRLCFSLKFIVYKKIYSSNRAFNCNKCNRCAGNAENASVSAVTVP